MSAPTIAAPVRDSRDPRARIEMMAILQELQRMGVGR